MTRSQYAEFKADYIAKRQEALKRTLSSVEKKIYAEILDKVFAQLKVVDGKVQSGAKNIALTGQIDKLFDQVQKSEFHKVVTQIVGDFRGITKKNAEYYKLVDDIQGNINSVYEKSKEKLNKSLGVDSKGKIKPGGFLDRISTDKTFKTRVKKALTTGIVSNTSLEKLKSDLSLVVVGNEKTNGGLTRHFETNVIDAYNSYDRTISTNFANSLGLHAFIYAGTKIKSTREFCRENAGKVFTREEALRWENKLNEDDGPIWIEEKDGPYDPFTRVGGYRCKHSVDWISKKEAIRRRPDLKSYYEKLEAA